MALETISDEVEYQLMNYLIEKYGDNDDNKLALIGYCKELLADEAEQLNQDAANSMIYFMGIWAITL